MVTLLVLMLHISSPLLKASITMFFFQGYALYVMVSFFCVCSRLVSVAGIVGILYWSVLSWRESRIPSARCQPVEKEPLSSAAWLPTIGNGTVISSWHELTPLR